MALTKMKAEYEGASTKMNSKNGVSDHRKSEGKSSPLSVFPGLEWSTRSPQESGFAPDRLESVMASAEKYTRGGGVVVRGGYLVATFGDPERWRDMNTRSVSKSWTGTVLGLAVDDGLVDLDHFVKDTWTGEGQVTHDYKRMDKGNQAKVTWRDLTTMTGGFLRTDGPDHRDNYAQNEPGEKFVYSSCGMWRLSQALTQLHSKNTKGVFQERITRDLGIPDSDWDLYYRGNPRPALEDFGEWDYSAFLDPPFEIAGHPVTGGGGWLFMGAKNMARFAHLFLMQGQWQGRQLISRDWIRQATTGTELNPGYGCNWFVTKAGFSHAGGGSDTHNLLVFPDDSLVVTFTHSFGPLGQPEPPWSFIKEIRSAIVGPPARREPERVLFRKQFHSVDDLEEWTFTGGAWQLANNLDDPYKSSRVLRQTIAGERAPARAITGEPIGSEYIAEVDVKAPEHGELPADAYAALLGSYRGEGDYVAVKVFAGKGEVALVRQRGAFSEELDRAPFRLQPGRWHRIGIVVYEDRVEGYVDGVPRVVSSQTHTLDRGRVALESNLREVLWDDLIVWQEDRGAVAWPQETGPLFERADDLGGSSGGSRYDGAYVLWSRGGAPTPSADACRFVHRKLLGNGLVEAVIEPTACESGIMIRDGMNSGAKVVAIGYQAGDGLRGWYRNVEGEAVETLEGMGHVSGPVRVRIVRTGDHFRLEYQGEYDVWHALGACDLPMRAEVSQGIYVSASAADGCTQSGFGAIRFAPTYLHEEHPLFDVSERVGSSVQGGSRYEGDNAYTLWSHGATPSAENEEYYTVNRKWSRDGFIEAVVNLNPGANGDGDGKAGLVYREEGEGGKCFSMCINGQGRVDVIFRETDHGSVTTLEGLGHVEGPARLRISKGKGEFLAEYQVDGGMWKTAAVRAIPMSDEGRLGLRFSSFSERAQDSASFSEIRFGGAFPQERGPLFAETLDIGEPCIEGGSSYDGNSNYTLWGGGKHLWDGSDQFRFLYRPVSGDGVIEAELNVVSAPIEWSKVGLIVRDTSGDKEPASYASVVLYRDKGIFCQFRDAKAPDGRSLRFGEHRYGLKGPVRVRLARQGDRFDVWYLDDKNWVHLGSQEVAMPSEVRAGLCATSTWRGHIAEFTCKGVKFDFDNEHSRKDDVRAGS